MSARTSGRTSPRRESFRDWRRSRPFWGGVTAIIAGIWTYALTAAPFSLLVIQGVAGVSALLIMLLFVMLSVITWFQPQLRTVTGLIIVFLALASILLTNLGGFLIGMLLGVHAGASIAAWKPREGQLPPGEPQANRPRPRVSETGPPTVSGVPDYLRAPQAAHLPAQAPGAGAGAGASAGAGAGAGAGVGAGAGAGALNAGPRARPRVARSVQANARTQAPDGQGPSPSPSLRRPRRPGRPQGLGMVLALLALGLTPVPRTAVTDPATGMRTAVPVMATTTAPRATLFCALLPWLCPELATSPGPASTPGPTASPPSSSGFPLPTIPGVTGPRTPAAPVPASSCDAAKMPARPALGSAAAKKAASIMQACVDLRKAGRTPAPTRVKDDGPGTVSAIPARVVAAKQTMTGLAYDGVASVKTASGPQRALKFRADTVTIEGFHQEVTQPKVKATLTGPDEVKLSGNVTLYVLKQSGKAFGLLPLTLDPDNPPPLVIPFMIFTDVDSQIAYENADLLTFPNGHITVT